MHREFIVHLINGSSVHVVFNDVDGAKFFDMWTNPKTKHPKTAILTKTKVGKSVIFHYEDIILVTDESP